MGWNDTEVKEKLHEEIGMSDTEADFLISHRKVNIKDKVKRKRTGEILDMLKEKEEEK